MKKSKSPHESESFIRQLLRETELPRDGLPYTDDFLRLKALYVEQTKQKLTDNEFWRAVSGTAKKGGLGTGKRKKSPPGPKLSDDQQLELMRLFPDGIGGRDRLPYTKEFEELRERFSRLTATNFSKRDFWRSVSSIAKRSHKPAPIEGPLPLLGLPEELVRCLEDQNPWWSGKSQPATQPFRRWAYREVVRRIDSGIAAIVALRGTRQVGKSEIQRQFIEELLLFRQVPPTHILRIRFDEVPTLGKFLMPVQAIVRWYEECVLKEPINAVARRGETVYFLLDELQNLTGWENQLKSLVDDRSVKVIATGSSALRIAQGQDSLAGRISLIQLGALRLREIAAIRFGETLPSPFPTENGLEKWATREFWRELVEYARRHEPLLRRSFQAFADFGGYPICHKIGDDSRISRFDLRDQVLSLVVERTILHDLKAGPQGRHRDQKTVEAIFRAACRFAGQAVTTKRLCQELQLLGHEAVSQQAATDALGFLSDSLLVTEIPPFEGIGKRAAYPSKLCLCDHFIREAWLQEQIPLDPSELSNVPEAASTQAGHLVESIVGTYLSGVPGLELSWLPATGTESEIDFILTIGLKRIPLEVKYRRHLKADDFAAVRAFCKQTKYNAPFGIVITRDSFVERDDVYCVPLFALLGIR